MDGNNEKDRPTIKTGQYGYGEPEVFRYGPDDKNGKLTIGKFCSISSNVKVLLGGEHTTNTISTYPFFAYWSEATGTGDYKTKGDVTIGNDVWIGYNVTILSGSTIEDGAVIGAGSLINGIISAYSISGGIPAKVIRYRFKQFQIERLLRIKWWEWSEQDIIRALPLLTSSDIDRFIKEYYV